MSENLAQRLGELPLFLSGHMLLAISALLVGVCISLPLGLAAVGRPRLRAASVTAASVIQTIPSLALLALMVPLLGGAIGFVPAFLALVLYSLLPMLRNTITGIEGVDPSLIEAARGVGMTRGQILRRVQLPLAAPVMIAGIRTATVWVVGMSTLSTPVGYASLGNYIFLGLQTRNSLAILFGCLFSAVLALALDQLIRLVEVATRQRRPGLLRVATAALLLLVLGSLAPRGYDLLRPRAVEIAAVTQEGQGEEPAAAPSPAVAREVILASKPFSEQYILADVLGRALSQEGYRPQNKPNMGSTIAFDALRNNSIDVYVDYSGTLWATVLKQEGGGTREEVLIEAAARLKREYGVVMLGPLGFENTYALAVQRQTAQRLGLASIADLKAHASRLKIGSDFEFFGRSEWSEVRQRYGLSFAQEVTMDPSLMYGAVRDQQVDVITSYSTDGRVLAFDLVTLRDPKQGFPPYDAVILLSPQAAAEPALVGALRPLLYQVGDEAMRRANKMVDVDGRPPEEAGRWLWEQIREPSLP